MYAPGIECAFTRYPVLESAFLYGGYPCKNLRHKFLMAQESDAEPLTKAVLPAGISLIGLPGHFFSMVGLRTPDDVVYLADCLSSKETLDKYPIGFVYDVAAYLDTLEKVKDMRAGPRRPHRGHRPPLLGTTSTRCGRLLRRSSTCAPYHWGLKSCFKSSLPPMA